ncbi:hypothetical protein MRX96_008953 [Rhipicephalus microplus]
MAMHMSQWPVAAVARRRFGGSPGSHLNLLLPASAEPACRRTPCSIDSQPPPPMPVRRCPYRAVSLRVEFLRPQKRDAFGDRISADVCMAWRGSCERR